MQVITPKEWLNIEVANQAGFDKLTWNDRINLVIPEGHIPKNPLRYAKAIQQRELALSGAYTNAAVTLDATASCVQFIALLTGNMELALMSNLLDTGKCQDAYTGLIGNLAEGRDRSELKSAVMQYLYGGTKKAKEVFGAHYKKFVKGLPSAVNEYLELTLGCWDNNSPAHSWTMPDGFQVIIPSHQKTVTEVNFMGGVYDVVQIKEAPSDHKNKSLPANVVHSVDGFVVRELLIRCNPPVPSKRKDREAINKLDSLRESSGFNSATRLFYEFDPSIKVAKEGFEILPNHDSFRCHVNHMQQLREIYVQILKEVAESDLLQHIIRELVNDPNFTLEKDDFSWSKHILDSDYAIS